MSRPAAPIDFPTTVPEAVERAARIAPKRGIAIFDGRARGYDRRTWPEVLAAVRRAAGCWLAAGLRPGDRVVIAQNTSWEWLDAWLGAVWIGALPVAAAPGAGLGPAEAQIRKVEGVVERLDARFALVSDVFRGSAESLGAPYSVERAIGPEQLFGLAPESVTAPTLSGTDLAFLQLTSGSTGIPRAVQITHRGILHNADSIDRRLGEPDRGPTATWADGIVSWLPLHHDMGLVGCVFVTMLAGIDLWLLQPTTFLARPQHWLRQLGTRGRTYTHGPNFGYQLCVERLESKDVEGLDLSNWCAAVTGAEMIRPETVEAFVEKFSPFGFRPESFRASYGLAEATLAVTSDALGRGLRTRPLPSEMAEEAVDADLSEVASVGPPMKDTEVRIVGPDGRSLPDGRVGEVAVRSPGVFTGYWNDAEATAESLVDGELRTGDLGFLHDGELYLTGRTKDLLIVRGNNLMPHEIEWLAEKVTGGGGALRSGAFSVSHGAKGEEAVVVVETQERDDDKVDDQKRDIRLEVSKGLGLVLADVVFVRRGRIPKTSSGKVQRRELRRMYLDGELA